MIMKELCWLVPVAYLIGSVPFGWILCKLFKGINLLESGSGSTGAANVQRILGIKWFIVTLLLDALKGAGAVLLGKHITGNISIGLGLGIVAILGHCFSIFLKLRGGKGVATLLGVSMATVPYPTIAAFALWIFMVWLCRYTSLAAIAGTIYLATIVILKTNEPFVIGVYVLIPLFYIFTHRENIKNLQNGIERRFSTKDKK